MSNIDDRSKEVFSVLEKKNVPDGFTDLVMQEVGGESTFRPLITSKVLVVVFAVFFVPPILLMFSVDSVETSRLSFFSEGFVRQAIGVFSYQGLELYILVGIVLFWSYLAFEKVFARLVPN